MSRISHRTAVVICIVLLGAASLTTPSSAHQGRGAHLWNRHFKKLSSEGSINHSRNPLHWSKLKGVPEGLADGVDAVDGGTAVNLGCASACVEDQEIKSVAASKITGPVMASDVACSDCVQGSDIAASTITSENIVENAIGQGELAAGSVGTAEVRNGAIVPSKVVSNADNSSGSQTATLDDATTSVDLAPVPLVFPGEGGEVHRVLLNGGALAQCDCLSGPVAVQVEFLENGNPIGFPFQVVLAEWSPTASFPLTWVATTNLSGGALPVIVYELRATIISGPTGSEVHISNAHMTAVDLGRA